MVIVVMESETLKIGPGHFLFGSAAWQILICTLSSEPHLYQGFCSKHILQKLKEHRSLMDKCVRSWFTRGSIDSQHSILI